MEWNMMELGGMNKRKLPGLVAREMVGGNGCGNQLRRLATVAGVVAKGKGSC
jgi:hypothetical protein